MRPQAAVGAASKGYDVDLTELLMSSQTPGPNAGHFGAAARQMIFV